MTTRTKLLALLASLLVFLLGSSGFAIRELARAGRDLRSLTEHDVPLTKLLGEITAGHLEQSIRFERGLRFAPGASRGAADASAYRRAGAEFESLSADIWRAIQRSKAIASETDPDAEYPVGALLGRIDAEHNEYAHAVRRVFARAEAGDLSAALTLAEAVQLREDRFDQVLGHLLVEAGARTETASLGAHAAENRAIVVVASLSAAGSLLAAVAYLYCVRLVSEIRSLGGLLPICASCKRIRDDRGYWNKLEAYLEAHSTAEFTHGICGECQSDLHRRIRAGASAPSGGLRGGAASAVG